MTIFGTNLTVIAREVEVSIDKLEAYKFNDSHAISLYDTVHVGVFLNLPLSVYENYNAWIQLPGEARIWLGNPVDMVIKESSIKIPKIVREKPIKNEWPDIFLYINKYYCSNVKEAVDMRIFDLIYTMARMNNMDLKSFLDLTAFKW